MERNSNSQPFCNYVYNESQLFVLFFTSVKIVDVFFLTIKMQLNIGHIGFTVFPKSMDFQYFNRYFNIKVDKKILMMVFFVQYYQSVYSDIFDLCLFNKLRQKYCAICNQLLVQQSFQIFVLQKTSSLYPVWQPQKQMLKKIWICFAQVCCQMH